MKFLKIFLLTTTIPIAFSPVLSSQTRSLINQFGKKIDAEFVAFEETMIILGRPTQAFRFKVDKTSSAAHFRWSYVVESPDQNRIVWGVVSAKDTMDEFGAFHSYTLTSDLDGIGKKGDMVITQGLNSSDLEDGADYIIWMQSQYQDLHSVHASLNFLRNDPFGNIRENSKRR